MELRKKWASCYDVNYQCGFVMCPDFLIFEVQVTYFSMFLAIIFENVILFNLSYTKLSVETTSATFDRYCRPR